MILFKNFRKIYRFYITSLYSILTVSKTVKFLFYSHFRIFMFIFDRKIKKRKFFKNNYINSLLTHTYKHYIMKLWNSVLGIFLINQFSLKKFISIFSIKKKRSTWKKKKNFVEWKHNNFSRPMNNFTRPLTMMPWKVVRRISRNFSTRIVSERLLYS